MLRPSRRGAPGLLLAGLLFAVPLLAGCGSSDDGADGAPPAAPPESNTTNFPRGGGKNVADLVSSMPEGPVLAPSVAVLEVGRNRFGFALFDRARKQLNASKVAIYVASEDGSRVRGPYAVRDESLAVQPAYRSQTTAQDPDAAQSVYVARLPLKRGKHRLIALADLDGRVVASSQISVEAGGVHTPTAADVGGDLSKIDTRVPPAASLHEVDFADVLGKKPVVLVFATPQLCQSRVCGPVVDITAQVQQKYGSKVAFIHEEIYKDNDPSKGFTQPVAAWHLPTEPWAFVIDGGGKITARFEGAFSAGELERAVAKVV